jgi:AraC-like DNA-binding protein
MTTYLLHKQFFTFGPVVLFNALSLNMYFTTLPDHADPSFSEKDHFSAFNKHNIIFNAQVHKSFCEKHVGCLSLKTVFSGEEWYSVNGVPLRVQKGQFLLLNQDQEYASRIDADLPVKSFSIFFKERFARTVLADTLRTEDQLLDQPYFEQNRTEFFQKLYTLEDSMQRQLASLLHLLNSHGYSSLLTDEQLIPILQSLIRLHQEERSIVPKVAALKCSTRTEIYRRLSLAKDVLHSLYDEDLDLDLLGRYACLSVPQLVRQFRKVYHATPHQYLTGIRMQKAGELLQHKEWGLADITLAIGLHDTSAFCRLFKKWYGTSPESYRKALS